MTNDSNANGRMSVLLLSLLLAMSAFATVAVATTGGSMNGDSGNGYMMNMESVTGPDNADGSYNQSQYIMMDLNVTGPQDGEDYTVHYAFVDASTGVMVHENWDNWTQGDASGYHITYASYYPTNAGCYGFGANLMNEYTDTNGSTFMASDAWVHWGLAVDVDPASCGGGGPGPVTGGALIDISHDNQRQELDVNSWNMTDGENYTIEVWIVDKNEGQNSHMPHVNNLMHNWMMNNTYPADAGWTQWQISPAEGITGTSNHADAISVGEDGCWGAIGIVSTTFQDGNIYWMMDFEEWQTPVESHTQCDSWFGGQGPGPGPMENIWIENFNFDWQAGDTMEMDVKLNGLDTSKPYSFNLDVYHVDEAPPPMDPTHVCNQNCSEEHWNPNNPDDLPPENLLPDYSFVTVLAGADGETQVWATSFGDTEPGSGGDLQESCYFVMITLLDEDMNVIGGTGSHFQVGQWKCMDQPPMPELELNIAGTTCNLEVDDMGNEFDNCKLVGPSLESSYDAYAVDLPMGEYQWCVMHLMAPMMEMDQDNSPWITALEDCGDGNVTDASTEVFSGTLLSGHNSMNMVLFYIMFDHQHDGNDTTSGHEHEDMGAPHETGEPGHCSDGSDLDESDCHGAGFEWIVDGHDGPNMDMMPQSVIDHMMTGQPFLMDMVSFCSGPLCSLMGEDNNQIEQIFMANSGPVKAEVWFEQWDNGQGHLNAHMVTTLSTSIRGFIDGTLGDNSGDVDLMEAEMFAGMFVWDDMKMITDYGMSESDCDTAYGEWHGLSADGIDYTEGDEPEHCHPPSEDEGQNENESWVLDGVHLGSPDYEWDGINIEALVGLVPTDSGSYDIEIDHGLGWDLDGLSDWATTDTHTLVISNSDVGGLMDPCGEDLGLYGEIIAGDSETWSVQEVTSDAAGWAWNVEADGDAKASFSCGAGSAALHSITIVYAKSVNDWNPENMDGHDGQNETIDWKDEDGDGEKDNSPPVCELYWATKSGNETSPNFESDTKFEENPNGTYEIELADGASYFIHMFCNDPDGDMISSSWSVGGIAMDSYLDASEGWGWVEFTVPEGVGGTVTIDYAWQSNDHAGSGSVVVTATGDGSGGDLTETIVESGGGSLPGFTAITAVAALVGALLIARRRD